MHVRLELAVEDQGDGVRRVDGRWESSHAHGPYDLYVIEGEVPEDAEGPVTFEVLDERGEKADASDLGARKGDVEGWLVDEAEKREAA